MTTITRTCPKCSKTMEQGLIVDHAHLGAPTWHTWIAGEPRRDWFNEKMPKGREIRVTTWKCAGCGYLESYADNRKAPRERS